VNGVIALTSAATLGLAVYDHQQKEDAGNKHLSKTEALVVGGVAAGAPTPKTRLPQCARASTFGVWGQRATRATRR
jgi:hypothetical protein